MKTLENVVSYLNGALAGFVVDPADSDYQEGYQAALEELKDFIVNG